MVPSFVEASLKAYASLKVGASGRGGRRGGRGMPLGLFTASHPPASTMDRFLWLVLAFRLSLCQESKDLFKDKDCAIVLSSAGAVVTGRDLCITYEDVEEAFRLARSKVGLRFPARQVTDLSIALLGTALQETTRILARRFWLSRWEVENVLPRLDTKKTDIGRFCAWPLRRPVAPCPQERYRRHDGTCNNLLDPARGAANLPFKRLLPPLYADRISEPRVGRDGSPLPAPRLVSTRVHGDVFKRHDLRVSFMFPAWGQLVDHDLTLTAETKEPESRKEFDCCANDVTKHPNCYPLEVPREDPFFREKRQNCMNMARSLAGVRHGCSLGSRTQINLLTSYIDANFIYGSSTKLSDSLRLFQKGLMKTFDAFPELGLQHLLPPKTKQPDDGCIRPHPDIFCFLAGDNRVNEQLALGVLHTLAVREHNRIATELAYINPHWDDEKLYQEARHIMAALIQHITYNEFLPQLLGDEYLEKYDLKLNPQGYIYSYDPEVDATIPASFGAAAFRFGHSLLPDAMQRRSPTHKLTGERRLSEMLQQPFDLYKPGWVDAYTLGMVNQVSQPMDQSVTAEVTNHLFQEPARDYGRDLAAINLGRAREHGIPGFMAYRKHCGLDDMHSWEDMWSSLPNATVTEYLKIYDHPDDVDLWSAGVSELPAPGSMLGPVFSCIIATTFRDLRKGDRFWYENRGFASSFTLSQLKEIKKYTLSRFLCNTGDNIETIQLKAMLLPDYDENPRVSCKSGEIPDLNLKYWKETPLNNEEAEKYPDKPHLVNHSSSNIPSSAGFPWQTPVEKEKPLSLYGAPPPPSEEPEKEMYSHDHHDVIYESDIKSEEKFPPKGEYDSLAFVMFSESDKYAIKEDYAYNKEKYQPHQDKPPSKGDSGSYTESIHLFDKYPSKGQIEYSSSNQQKYPDKIQDDYNSPFHVSHPSNTKPDYYTTKDPVKESEDYYRPSQGTYSMLNSDYLPPAYDKIPTKEQSDSPSDISEKEVYSSTDTSDMYSLGSYQKDPVDDSKPEHYTPNKYFEQPADMYSSEIHYGIKDKLEPPFLEPESQPDFSYNKENYNSKGDDSGISNAKGNEQHDKDINKGYFITTASYDFEKYANKGTTASYVDKDVHLIKEPTEGAQYENDKYIKDKLQNKGSSVSTKPMGFDQIVTDLFHDVNNNKSDLVLELKDTYNINTNIIQGKSEQKEP